MCKLKKCFILSHLGLGDHGHNIGVIRYLSTKYDESIVVCKNSNIKNIIFSKSYLKNTSTSLVSLFSSQIMKNFTHLYKKHKPNMVIVLGDRYEILSSIIPLIFFKFAQLL